MMSSDGAPRAKEIALAMVWRLREAHVDARPVGSLVASNDDVADTAHARERRFEVVERLDARERAGRHGHMAGLGASPMRERQHARVTVEQFPHRGDQPLGELDEGPDLDAGVKRGLGDGRRRWWLGRHGRLGRRWRWRPGHRGWRW